MSMVGDRLKQAREAQKLTVYQVAEMTKIRTDHIRAIDEGNFDVFSAPVYIRGFVRSYANALKLDPKEILDLLSRELGAGNAHEPLIHQTPKSGMDAVMYELSKLNRRMVLRSVAAIAILVVAGSGFYVWNKRQHEDPAAGIGTELYHYHGNGDTLPLPALR